MASIRDALEETLQDNHAIIKLSIYTAPLFWCVYSYMNNNENFATIFYLIAYLLLFGFLLKCTHNVKNGKEYVLPSINVFDTFWTGLKGTIALLPIIILVSIIGAFVMSLFEQFIPDPNILKVVNFIIGLVCASVAFTGYILYTQRFKITDAYNFKLISDHCIDIIIGVYFMYLKMIIVNAIILIPLLYILWLFLGLQTGVCIFVYCFIVVANIAAMGHYLAQMDYETITVREENK